MMGVYLSNPFYCSHHNADWEYKSVRVSKKTQISLIENSEEEPFALSEQIVEYVNHAYHYLYPYKTLLRYLWLCSGHPCMLWIRLSIFQIDCQLRTVPTHLIHDPYLQCVHNQPI